MIIVVIVIVVIVIIVEAAQRPGGQAGRPAGRLAAAADTYYDC